MQTVKIRNIDIGSGIPKICVPIVAVTKKEILNDAINLKSFKVDIVEWRVDFYEDAFDILKLIETLFDLRKCLSKIALLFTFRTSKEGGERNIDPKAYAALNIAVAKTGLIDLVDVEIFTGDDIVREIIEKSHNAGVKVIASNHDFLTTPSKEEIVSRLIKMQNFGADIPKIAVMPKNRNDVLTLLLATEEMNSNYGKTPIITISMSNLGLISRLCGEIFGSCITFASSKKISAPGQINIDEIYEFLKIIHKST